MRVLVVDDSRSMRHFLRQMITEEGDMEVVGEAEDPYEARDLIKALNPDVITLDVEMPKMDGLSFLRNIMRLRPMPVVLVSGLLASNIRIAVEALETGAVDVLAKPAGGITALFGEQLRDKLRIAGTRTVEQLKRGTIASATAAPLRATRAAAAPTHVNRIIAIGASTGGTTAIKEVLRELPANLPPIMISQHIPERFSGPFAVSTNRMTELTVVEAEHGQPVQNGHVYIAPGNHHLTLLREGTGYSCHLLDSERVNGHRPSVGVMFDSINDVMGDRAISVLLTGMGNDGAAAMLRMREAGAYTVAQDEESSVVWGMPGEAAKMGAAQRVLPLHEVAESIVTWVETRSRTRSAAAAVPSAAFGGV